LKKIDSWFQRKIYLFETKEKFFTQSPYQFTNPQLVPEDRVWEKESELVKASD